MRNGDWTGNLAVIQNSETQIIFDLNVVSPIAHVGTIQGTANLADGIAYFNSRERSCSLAFHFGEKKVGITQSGGCSFGSGVYADGAYFLNAKEKPDIRLEKN